MQHPRMSLIVFDRRRWSWGNQLWQSRDKKKKKKRERGSTSRTAWGSIYKRAAKLSDFKKGSGLIKQPIVDAKQLRRSAFPVIGSKRLSWCVRSAGQRQQTGSMSCESAELFDSTGLRDLKRRLGLLCSMQRFCRWHRVVAACLQRKLLGPLALWPGDNNSDGSSTRRICTSFHLKILAALPHSRGAHQLQKNRSPLNVWHVARITAYLRCDVSGDIQHTLTSIRGKPIWE